MGECSLVLVRLQGNEWLHLLRRLTTHSTGARVSWSFIVNLAVSGLNARPVNSGVRFLLNGLTQKPNQLS